MILIYLANDDIGAVSCVQLDVDYVWRNSFF